MISFGFFLLMIALLFFCHIRARDEEREIPEWLEPESFRPVMLLPACRRMAELLPSRLVEVETVRLMPRVNMLHGTGDANTRLKIHMAGKCLYGCVGMLTGGLLSAAAGLGSAGFLMIPVGGCMFWFLADHQLVTRCEKRRKKLEREFPDVVSLLALLTGAGLTVRQALHRITQDQTDPAHLLRQEMKRLLDDMTGGMPEAQAWSELSERCRIRETATLAGILLQHARLGGAHLAQELRRLASDSWEARKHAAKRLGEEASAKLMIPLGILLVAVLTVCAAPAFLAIGGVM